MATGIGVNRGKTAFLEMYLPGNRAADLSAVNEAWRGAGNEGTVSESLVNKIRSRLKLTGKGRSEGGGSRVTAGPSQKGKAKTPPEGDEAKRRPKAEEAPSRANGRSGGTGTGKTEFIRGQFRRDGTLGVKAIKGAWEAAGHEGSISDNLIYKTRADLRIGGKSAPSARREAGAADPVSSPEGNGPNVPEAVESPTPLANGRRPIPSLTNQMNSSHVGGHGRELHDIEGKIDGLIYKLRGLGNYAEVMEALRAARRLLVRSHGE